MGLGLGLGFSVRVRVRALIRFGWIGKGEGRIGDNLINLITLGPCMNLLDTI